jgi:hypothetical protein
VRWRIYQHHRRQHHLCWHRSKSQVGTCATHAGTFVDTPSARSTPTQPQPRLAGQGRGVTGPQKAPQVEITADAAAITPTTPLVGTTTPPIAFADTILQQTDTATHPANTARTKEPGRGLSDPSFATCLHPNGPRTFLL